MKMEYKSRNHTRLTRKSDNHEYNLIIRGNCTTEGLSKLLYHVLLGKENRVPISMKKYYTDLLEIKKGV